jgi:hypothetical protein
MPEPNRSDEAMVEIRRWAVCRLLVAVGLLAAAFGGLLLFERYTASRVAQAPPRAALEAVTPVPPAEPAPAAPAAAAPGEQDRAPGAAAEPERSEATARDPIAPPRVVNNERLVAPPPGPSRDAGDARAGSGGRRPGRADGAAAGAHRSAHP